MDDKNSFFWKQVKADRVRYFGPNPPGPLGPDNFVDLLRPDPPPDLANDLIASAGDFVESPDQKPTVLNVDPGDVIRSGTTGPLSRPPDNKLPFEAGSSPPLVPSVRPPIDLPPLTIPTIDESLSGATPDVSGIGLPPGCFSPSTSPPAGIPISAGAMDYPGPAAAQLPGSLPDGLPDLGPISDLISSPSDPGCFTPSGSADGETLGSGAAAGMPRLVADSGNLSGCVVPITVSLGDGHRALKNLLSQIAGKLDRLSVDNAQREVRRAFDLYQANRRAMFSVFSGRR